MKRKRSPRSVIFFPFSRERIEARPAATQAAGSPSVRGPLPSLECVAHPPPGYGLGFCSPVRFTAERLSPDVIPLTNSVGYYQSSSTDCSGKINCRLHTSRDTSALQETILERVELARVPRERSNLYRVWETHPTMGVITATDLKCSGALPDLRGPATPRGRAQGAGRVGHQSLVPS